MRLIEMETLSNGAHRNQTPTVPVQPPEGWAVIPDDMICENFPFGSVEAEEIDGVLTVTNWTPGEIPATEPAASTPTLSERVGDLEQAMDALLGGES